MKKRMIVLCLGFLLLLPGCTSSEGAAESSAPEETASSSTVAAESPAPSKQNRQPWDQSQALEAWSHMKSYYGENWPEHYGGCYIDGDNILNIWVVGLDPQLAAEYNTACGTGEILLKNADYSFAELEQAAQALNDYNEDLVDPICLTWGIDEQQNRVDISVPERLAEEAEDFCQSWPCIQMTVLTAALEVSDQGDKIPGTELTLTPEYETYPAGVDTLYFFVENHMEEPAYMDQALGLEVWLKDQWYAVPYRPDAAFTADLWGVDGGGVRGVAAWLNSFNYDFPEGQYRACLYYDADTSGKPDFDHVAYGEFSIQERAYLPSFSELTRQSMDPEQEERDGCVVLEGETCRNPALMAAFVKKVLARIPCQVRVVDADTNTIRHITWKTGTFEVVSFSGGVEKLQKYAYIALGEAGDILLSAFVDPQNAEFSTGEETLTIFPARAAAFLEKGTTERIADHTARQLEGNSIRQTVYSQDGAYSVSLAKTLWYEEGDKEGYFQYDLYLSSDQGSASLWMGQEWKERERHPVYVFPMENSEFGVLFASPEGEYEIRVLDARRGEFTQTLPAEPEDIPALRGGVQKT